MCLYTYILTYFKTYNFIYSKEENNYLNLILVKKFNKITTPNYRQLVINFQKRIILNKIKNINEDLLNQIIDIIKDCEEYEGDFIINKETIINKIINNELYCINNIFILLYPEYKFDEYYNFLISAKNSDIGINSIQEYENKLFMQ